MVPDWRTGNLADMEAKTFPDKSPDSRKILIIPKVE